MASKSLISIFNRFELGFDFVFFFLGGGGLGSFGGSTYRENKKWNFPR